MNLLIDFHSHFIKNNVHKYILINKKTKDNYFVKGVHPWDLETKIDALDFNKYIKDDFFLGIGEIGLDKLKPNFDLQISRFDQQVKIAVNLNIVFLVIHNVKSSQEIIKILKDNNYKGIINLHGFNSTLENLKQFSSNFSTIVSIGQHYLKSPKLQAVVNQLELDQFYFESDDSSLDILDLYKLYALQKNISLDDLIQRLSHNFTKLIKTLNIQH